MFQKIKTKYKKYIRLLPALIGLGLVISCANIARPGGGPRDIDPPVFLRGEPTPQQTNYKKNRLELIFDENVTINNPMEKVVVSPAQKEPPVIRANGKRVTVELKDSLRENTTYSIDFTDAIADNNESNKLENFGYSFSTGPVIDTMQVYGYLLNAADLEPITGMLVGLHRSLNDSAFVKEPLERLALTDSYGRFSIRNISPGTYRIYALKDISRNYYYDTPAEDIAFDTTLIVPKVEMKMHADTIWADSTTIDTIVMLNLPHYYPDDIVLRAFNENYKQQYLDKSERLNERYFSLYFNAEADTLPRITPLNFQADNWYFIEKTPGNDTITYWIKDSTIYKQDTLQFALHYMRTDSALQLTPFDDTIRLIYKRPRLNNPNEHKRKRKIVDSLQVPPTPMIEVSCTANPSFNIFDKIILTPAEPLIAFDTTGVALYIKQDSTTYHPVPFNMQRDPQNPRRYIIDTKWQPSTTYRFQVDSAVMTGLYGLHNDDITKDFTVRSLDTYSRLNVLIHGIDGSAFVQVLTSNDTPVAQAKVKNGRAVFRYLEPGKYYLRLVADKNENNKFDTGNLLNKQQPEMVYYYPESVELRANWVIDQDWDVTALPLYRQKPLEITKNKPKEKVYTDEEDEMYLNNDNNGGGFSSFGSALGGVRGFGR